MPQRQDEFAPSSSFLSEPLQGFSVGERCVEQKQAREVMARFPQSSASFSSPCANARTPSCFHLSKTSASSSPRLHLVRHYLVGNIKVLELQRKRKTPIRIVGDLQRLLLEPLRLQKSGNVVVLLLGTASLARSSFAASKSLRRTAVWYSKIEVRSW